MLEWIAVITMLIDHIGYTFFPDNSVWRIIGRFAFPIYTYLVVMGLHHTRNRKNYFKRLIGLAMISQVTFSLLFETYSLNVIFTLLYGASAIVLYKRMSRLWGGVMLFVLGAILAPISQFMDYGLYGYVLFILYYFLKDKPVALLIGHIFLNLTYSGYYYGSWYAIQTFSILATLLIIYKPYLPSVTIPRLFYRSFYPSHLLILYFIAFLL